MSSTGQPSLHSECQDIKRLCLLKKIEMKWKRRKERENPLGTRLTSESQARMPLPPSAGWYAPLFPAAIFFSAALWFLISCQL